MLKIMSAFIAFAVLAACEDSSFGEHMSTVSWLPSTASDISYSHNRGWRAYEFSITESDFRNWAAADYSLSEVTSPVNVLRYCAIRDGFRAPGSSIVVIDGLHS